MGALGKKTEEANAAGELLDRVAVNRCQYQEVSFKLGSLRFIQSLQHQKNLLHWKSVLIYRFFYQRFYSLYLKQSG